MKMPLVRFFLWALLVITFITLNAFIVGFSFAAVSSIGSQSLEVVIPWSLGTTLYAIFCIVLAVCMFINLDET